MADFGFAVEALKNGRRVTNMEWDFYKIWLELQVPDESSKMTLPYICTCFDEGESISRIPWSISHNDVLSTNWAILE